MRRRTTARAWCACAFVAFVAFAAVGVRGEARARGAPSARADVRTLADDATADVNDVVMFMEKARAELLVSLASEHGGGAHARTTPTEFAAPADWIADFFSTPAEARRRSADARRGADASRSRARRGAAGLPDVVIDDNAMAFFFAAREFANANSVTDPRSGRMTISLRDAPSSRAAEEPHPYQWWYDFLWLTQRRYIDCETDEDCASIFHRGEGKCSVASLRFACLVKLTACVPTSNIK